MSAQPSKASGFIKVLIVVVVLVAGAFFASRTLRPTAKVAVVGPGPAVKSVPGSVLVTATRISPLTSEIGGRIQKSELEPGKVVKEGDIVAQLDTGDIDLEIEKIQIDLEALKKKVAAGTGTALDLETAEENLENAKRAHARNQLSDLELARQKRTVDGTKLRLAQEEIANQGLIDTYDNMLKVKQRQRSKMTIRAPFDGVVSAVFARKDDQISNNFSIATLLAITRHVEAKISEENFASVEIGQRAVVRFLTYGDDRFDGTVISKLPTAELGTQRYIARLEVKNIPPEKLLPDLTGDVNVIVDERQTQTRIPRRALAGTIVFVVKDGRVEMRKVKPGYTTMNFAEILEGLRAGEQVIVDALDQFKDGDSVRVEVAK